MTPSAPTQLDYGKPPPVHRRKWFHRALIAVAIFCVVIAGWIEGPPIWRQIRARYYLRQCMAYTAPPDGVVYESDLSREVARSQDLHFWSDGMVSLSGSAAKPPDCWDYFRSTGFSGMTINGAPILFLHQLATRDGQKHLVCLTMTRLDDQLWEFHYLVQEDLNYCRSCVDFFHIYRPVEAGTLRLFAGQPDPSNSSHFTLGYQINDERGTIDGWLDIPEHITFQVRDGPASAAGLLQHRKSPVTLP